MRKAPTEAKQDFPYIYIYIYIYIYYIDIDYILYIYIYIYILYIYIYIYRLYYIYIYMYVYIIFPFSLNSYRENFAPKTITLKTEKNSWHKLTNREMNQLNEVGKNY